MTKCDPYHHDAINVHIHNVVKQSTLASDTEITYYFMRKLKESAVQQAAHLPLLTNMHLKGYVPDGRHTWIATNKHPIGVDQFIEVKAIRIGSVQYGRPDARDNHKGAVAVQYYQGQVKPKYIAQMKRKDNVHFGTGSDDKGPLETIFRKLEFKPVVFGTFGEINSNVKDFIDLAVDYGAEHLGKSLAASTIDIVRQALKKGTRHNHQWLHGGGTRI